MSNAGNRAEGDVQNFDNSVDQSYDQGEQQGEKQGQSSGTALKTLLTDVCRRLVNHEIDGHLSCELALIPGILE